MRITSNTWISALLIVGVLGYMAYTQMQKGNTQTAMIMGGIGGAIVLVVGAYFFLRVLKGSLKLELAQKSVVSGQTISGQLQLHTKKAIHADRLYIALIGERLRRRRSGSSSNDREYWDEFYRDEMDVLVNEPLHAGLRQSVDFELNAPSEHQAMTFGQAIQSAGDEMESEAAKAVMKGVGAVASVMGGRKRWRVISRLETKGVDLAASKKLHVSLKQL